MARWSALQDYLATAPDSCTLSIDELVDIVGSLPQSALRHRAWWSGQRPHVQAWRVAGYVLDHLDLGRSVTLRRAAAASTGRQQPLAGTTGQHLPSTAPPGDRPDIILVSCSASKLKTPAAARDLYVSPLFRKQRAYAEAAGVPWFILSAEHALVAPDEWLRPYDRYLANTPPSFRAAWGVWCAERLELLGGPLAGKVVEIHAAAAYSEAVAPSLAAKGARVHRPLAGLRQGEQLSYYSSHPPPLLRETPGTGPSDTPLVDGYVAALLDESRGMTANEFLAQEPASLRMPGLYTWWVDSSGAADLSRGAGAAVGPGLIYAGLAGATRWPSGKRSSNTLWSRISGMHLGGLKEFSTFRRSLGALLTEDGSDMDEVELTAWMRAHLKVVAVVHSDADNLGALETEVLAVLDPPLNLQGMPTTPIRRTLKSRRRRRVN